MSCGSAGNLNGAGERCWEIKDTVGNYSPTESHFKDFNGYLGDGQKNMTAYSGRLIPESHLVVVKLTLFYVSIRFYNPVVDPLPILFFFHRFKQAISVPDICFGFFR